MPTIEQVRAKLKEEKSEMTATQEQVVIDVISGRNLFFTGAAGTGKSFVIDVLTKYVLPPAPATLVTAATGLAAVNIRGSTLHSAMHVGLAEQSAKYLAQKIKGNEDNYDDWMRAKHLICDEISMIDADFLDKLDEVARLVRENDKPFGGIQVIVSGDFWQLPPVGPTAKFVFESNFWKRHILTWIELKEIFRQKDPLFKQVLEEIKNRPEAGFSKFVIDFLRARSKPLPPKNGIKPTHLYPINAMVNEENERALKALPGDMWIIDCVDSGDASYKGRLDKVVRAPPQLKIKIQSQVMHLKNDQNDKTLVNGSRGVVVRVEMPTIGVKYMDADVFASTKEGKERDSKWINYKPPIAPTVTVPFIPSPVSSDLNTDIKATPVSLEILQALLGKAAPSALPTPTAPSPQQPVTSSPAPVVPEPPRKPRVYWFKPASKRAETELIVWIRALNGREYPVKLFEWKITEHHRPKATRKQIPLMGADAMSIHKSQGQSIDYLKVSLSKCFEYGQGYVAISRGTNPEGLQVTDFDLSKFKAHPKAIEFAKKLAEKQTCFGMRRGLSSSSSPPSPPKPIAVPPTCVVVPRFSDKILESAVIAMQEAKKKQAERAAQPPSPIESESKETKNVEPREKKSRKRESARDDMKQVMLPFGTADTHVSEWESDDNHDVKKQKLEAHVMST